MDKQTKENKVGIKRQTLAIIITAVTTVAVVILLVVMLVTHADRELTKIEITSLPDKTEYIEKQTLDTTGLTVKAYFGDEAAEVSDYSVDKTVLELGDNAVTVSYTNKKITKTASFPIIVVQKNLSSIEITKQPDKTVYLEGAFFEPSGTEVTAHYDNGESFVIDDWKHNGINALTLSDKSVIVSFGGKTASIPITVEQKRLNGLYLNRLPNKLEYVEGEYFDFLGLELYAKHENASDERVYDWALDAVEPLKITDNAVTVSYTLHGITKSVVIDIDVAAAEKIGEKQRLLSDLINLLPQTDSLTVEDLGALNYVLSVLDTVELSEDQQILKDELSAKRDVLASELPEEPEKVFNITYGIKGGLVFEDISYGDNPTTVKDGQSFELKAATSGIAIGQGYKFSGWSMDGKPVTSVSNIDSDKTIYAVFTLTSTVNLIFKDRITDAELWKVNTLRTDCYDFEVEKVSEVIINDKGVLPVAYYTADGDRADRVDLNTGSEVIVYVSNTLARELHLPDGNLFAVGWEYKFQVDGVNDETVALAQTGSVFYIPIGAEVVVTSMNANIDSIFLDGENIGTRLNSTVVNAVFVMTEKAHPASVTYTTKLLDVTTLSFVGQNVHSVVYPVGWNGVMAEIDLNNLAFIYDENNVNYVNTYFIGDVGFCFDELASYVFGGDTVIIVTKQRNNFALTVKYTNGSEKIDNITGKQTLGSALAAFDPDALSLLNTVLNNSSLFFDEAMTQAITKDHLLSLTVRSNITVYSDWVFVQTEPVAPSFEPVDYSAYPFTNVWNSLFNMNGDILSCELILAADGSYSYKTFVNGDVSANIHGVYRLNNGRIELKTFVSVYEYDTVSSNDLTMDISFSQDGLLLTKFIELKGTQKTVFEQVLFCGSVRPVNYSGAKFVRSCEIDGTEIVLYENGTAEIRLEDTVVTAYYRVSEGGRIYLMENGTIGTGDITDILGGYQS